MYKASIENRSGNVLLLTGDEAIYQVTSIVGLNPPPANINTTPIVGMDGGLFNSSKLETRNIVITVRINGAVERNRLALYQYFRTKEWCRFYYTNGSVDVYIDGYVEKVDLDLFAAKGEIAQISIICPRPYFRDLATIVTDISNSKAAFVFPFSIEEDDPIPFSEYSASRVTDVANGSQSDTGVTITVTFSGAASYITIQNTSTGEYFTVTYAFLAGDQLTISTYQGAKAVKLTRSGVTTNLLSAVDQGSTFFQLTPGSNPFGLATDGADEDIVVTFAHANEYRGV